MDIINWIWFYIISMGILFVIFSVYAIIRFEEHKKSISDLKYQLDIKNYEIENLSIKIEILKDQIT